MELYRTKNISRKLSYHRQHLTFCSKQRAGKMFIDLNPVRNFVLYVLLVLFFQIGWVLKGIPHIDRFIMKGFDRISGICLPLDVYWESLFGWEMLATVWRCIQIDLNKKVSPTEKAPDAPVFYLEQNNNNGNNDPNDVQMSNLLHHAANDRPLVLNFGSLSCPVFTAKLESFLSIKEEFQDVADFAIVYIEEAHPSDGWAFKSDIKIKAHNSIEDRCIAARMFLETYSPNCPVLVDSMLDIACMSYGATPIRLHIVKNGILEYEGGPGPFMYDLKSVREWLENYKKT